MMKQIKVHLNKSIQIILRQKVNSSNKVNRTLRVKEVYHMKLWFIQFWKGKESLSKKLLDAKLAASNSIFIQRYHQIKPVPFSALFKEFTRPIPLNYALPIFASDGSDIYVPRNPMDTETSTPNLFESWLKLWPCFFNSYIWTLSS